MPVNTAISRSTSSRTQCSMARQSASTAPSAWRQGNDFGPRISSEPLRAAQHPGNDETVEPKGPCPGRGAAFSRRCAASSGHDAPQSRDPTQQGRHAMNFDFSDEQKQLRDTARKFLAEKCPPKAVRAVVDGKAPYDRELWKGLAEMGFLGVAIPEAYGGAGAGHLELCVIAEEMGRALAPVPFSSTVYLAAEALLLAGTDAQKRKWLPLIASGEAIGTLALFEGKGNPSPQAIKLTASGGNLNGVKKPRPDGAVADFVVVAARTGASGRDSDISLFLVDMKAGGAEAKALTNVDPSRGQADLV